MTQDIHKYEQRLESTFENLQNSDEIREESEELSEHFEMVLRLRENDSEVQSAFQTLDWNIFRKWKTCPKR